MPYCNKHGMNWTGYCSGCRREKIEADNALERQEDLLWRIAEQSAASSRSATTAAGQRNQTACGACGQYYAESTRKLPVPGKRWVGYLAEHTAEGVCPKCHRERKERGEELDWTVQDWESYYNRLAGACTDPAGFRELLRSIPAGRKSALGTLVRDLKARYGATLMQKVASATSSAAVERLVDAHSECSEDPGLWKTIEERAGLLREAERREAEERTQREQAEQRERERLRLLAKEEEVAYEKSLRGRRAVGAVGAAVGAVGPAVLLAILVAGGLFVCWSLSMGTLFETLEGRFDEGGTWLALAVGLPGVGWTAGIVGGTLASMRRGRSDAFESAGCVGGCMATAAITVAVQVGLILLVMLVGLLVAYGADLEVSDLEERYEPLAMFFLVGIGLFAPATMGWLSR
jgi:hypothetical protein